MVLNPLSIFSSSFSFYIIFLFFLLNLRVSFSYADLLNMVDTLSLSLLSTPPISQSNSRQVSTWVSWQTELPLLQARDILERCLRSFVEQHTELPEEQWSSSVEREILSSLASIQLQPAIMDKYRRFVVLDGQQGEGHTPGGVSPSFQAIFFR